MKQIRLRRKDGSDYFAKVDEEFFEDIIFRCKHCKRKRDWSASIHKEGGIYAYGKEGTKTILMHRRIMEMHLGRSLEKNEEIDHIDHDGLNNQLSNLRICNSSQNKWNRRTELRDFTKYINIDLVGSKWYARIGINYRSIRSWKKFDTEKEAASEADLLAIKYHGNFATLNFENRREEYINTIKVGWEPTPARTKVSKYPGITFNKSEKHSKNAWAADFWQHGKKVLHVGHFTTEEDAATERDLAAIKHFGENTDLLIFPRRRQQYIEKIRSGYDPKIKRNKSSKYVGVNFQPRKKTNPWRSYIERNGKRTYLGDFPTEEEANEARLNWHLQHSDDFG